MVSKIEGTILYSVVGRTQYGFDIFSVSLPKDDISAGHLSDSQRLCETQLTDGISVNFNGCFGSDADTEAKLAYVSERSGSARIYIEGLEGVSVVQTLKGAVRGSDEEEDLFYDRPVLAGRKVFFVSTQGGTNSYRQSWSTVYVTTRDTGETVRLTPRGVADMSPSVSPSGKWVAVATYENAGWEGEVEDLHTDICIFKAEDGTERKVVAKNGGWPTWGDNGSVYFHRKAEDGWWSIFKVDVTEGPEERVTPPCVHAFTPSAADGWLAVTTRRPESKFRQIELFLTDKKEFVAVTTAQRHHYNPFVAPGKVAYHRCRDVAGGGNGKAPPLVARLEPIVSPIPTLPLVRVDGFFPSLSPCRRFIAYVRSLPGSDTQGLFVMKSDGSKSWHVSPLGLFTTAWDPVRPGVIYCTLGRGFAAANATVHVAAVRFDLAALVDDVDVVSSDVEPLTLTGTANNGFPFASPDGEHIVFRSGRGGTNSKNLYIMSTRGESTSIRRLTSGNWTDTMPAWSPDGHWIAFSSNRDGANPEHFALYMVRPDGTDLHRVIPNASQHGAIHGRVNHVSFSPDSQSIVFTADLAALSAEPVSLPNQFQPYGEIFLSRTDGSDIRRLTHNAYEDGTPFWAPARIDLPQLESGCDPSYSEPLRGDFSDPLWLGRITEEMTGACC